MITTVFRGNEVNVKEYLTLVEGLSFVKNVVNNIVDTNEGTFEPTFLDVSLICGFLASYTEIKDVDIDEVYVNMNEYKDFKDTVICTREFNIEQYDSLLAAIDKEIEFKKQQIIHNKSSAMDDMFVSFNVLLSTLNDKTKDLDVKKLDKIIKKISPDEILKSYKKSGIGNDMRDKAIEEQAKENAKLKNELSARNVKA